MIRARNDRRTDRVRRKDSDARLLISEILVPVIIVVLRNNTSKIGRCTG